MCMIGYGLFHICPPFLPRNMYELYESCIDILVMNGDATCCSKFHISKKKPRKLLNFLRIKPCLAYLGHPCPARPPSASPCISPDPPSDARLSDPTSFRPARKEAASSERTARACRTRPGRTAPPGSTRTASAPTPRRSGRARGRRRPPARAPTGRSGRSSAGSGRGQRIEGLARERGTRRTISSFSSSSWITWQVLLQGRSTALW
mmetsp:Transcript_36732/g.85822  ORF Transcript_36732/g.85822 Transcript_36732/m.85822 type:complete len:206 (+) Transcript_36732:157-774(+)